MHIIEMEPFFHAISIKKDIAEDSRVASDFEREGESWCIGFYNLNPVACNPKPKRSALEITAKFSIFVCDEEVIHIF